MRRASLIRVALILSNLDEDGAQTVVCTLLRNLDRSKYFPQLYVLSSEVENKLSKQLREANIKFQFLQKERCYKTIRTIDIIYCLNKEISLFQPDVIHVHLDTLYSWIWSLVRRKRIIFTVHSEANRICNKFSLKLYRKLEHKNLIRVTGVSDFASHRFEEVFRARNVKTIYNPVDIKYFGKNIKLKEHEGVRFINIARFSPVKNHKLLIDAFEIVCRERNDVQLFLVGDGQEYENIKRYVIEKNIERNVIFTGYRDDVLELLAQADIFVICSLSETLGVSAIEAMATGLPVIVTRVGGLPELVNDNGILVDTNNISQLADAMLLLAKEDEKRKQMGEKSLKKVETFDISDIILQYEHLYDEEAAR